MGYSAFGRCAWFAAAHEGLSVCDTEAERASTSGWCAGAEGVMMQQTTVAAPTVRRATADDASTVLAARRRLVDAGLNLVDIPGTLDAVAAMLVDPAVVISYAMQEGMPVGLALQVRTADLRVYVRMVGVVPEARRQGVGTALLATGLFAVLPIAALYAYLPGDVHGALEWAKHRGFRESTASLQGTAGGLIELELRLDAPAHGCGCGGDGCGSSSCHH